MALCPNGVIIMKSSLVSSPTLSRVSHSPSSLSCSSFSLMSMSSVPPRKRRRIIEGSSCTTFLSSSGTSGIGDTRDNNTNGSYSLLEKLFQRTDQPAYYSFTTSSNTCRTDRSYSVDHTSTPEVIPLSFLSRKRAVSSFLEDRILGQLVTQPQLRRENSSLILDRSISSIEETYECPDIPMPSSGSSSNVGVSGDCSRSASVSNGSRNGDNNNKLQRTPMCARCRNHNIETRVKGHKRICSYKLCQCDLCKLTVVRQEVMARQVKVRRAQDEDKKFNRRSDIAATLNIGHETEDTIDKRSMPMTSQSYCPMFPCS